MSWYLSQSTGIAGFAIDLNFEQVRKSVFYISDRSIILSHPHIEAVVVGIQVRPVGGEVVPHDDNGALLQQSSELLSERRVEHAGRDTFHDQFRDLNIHMYNELMTMKSPMTFFRSKWLCAYRGMMYM